MGNPDKEREAYGGGWAAAPPTDDLPPSYQYAPPPGPPPGFSGQAAAAPAAYDAGPSNTGGSPPVASTTTVRFPQEMTLYTPVLHPRTWHLGPSKDNLLHMVSLHKDPTLLKDGPEKGSPDLASFMNDTSAGYSQSVITIFPRPGSEIKHNLTFSLLGSYEKQHRFELEVGQGPSRRREWFAWVDSKNVQGYELVRLGAPGSQPMAFGVYEMNPFKGSKAGYIKFNESLGETFEIAALATWLRVYLIIAAAGLGMAA